MDGSIGLRTRERAYSYVRFSRPEQLKGDSLARQLELSQQYADAHGFDLDTSLRDLGVSSAKGLNRLKGALGAFYAAVETGRVPSGSHLLVESLDRLSREEVIDAQLAFLNLIQKGITIHTVSDKQVYNRQTLKNPMLLFGSLFIMARANEENVTKGKRVRDNKQRKRVLAAATGEPMTTSCPGWMKVVTEGGRRQHSLIPERVTVIRRMFDMNIGGMGIVKITNILNEQNVPPFSAKGKGWHAWYVSKILTGREVLGEFQPKLRNIDTEGKRQPTGERLIGYYPEAIKPEIWERALAARSGRRKSTGRKDGPLGGYSNLLSGLCWCGGCGSRMRIMTKDRTYLVCTHGHRHTHCENRVHFDYQSVEDSLFERIGTLTLTERDFEKESKATAIDDEITTATAELARQAKLRTQLLLRQNDPDLSESVWDAVRELASQQRHTEKRIGDMRLQLSVLRGSVSREAQLAEMKTVLDAARSGNIEARARIAEGFRAIIDFALFLPERRSVIISVGAMMACYEFRSGEELAYWGAGRARTIPSDWLPYLRRLPQTVLDMESPEVCSRRLRAIERANESRPSTAQLLPENVHYPKID